MTDDTDLNHRVAVEVMGWAIDTSVGGDMSYYDSNGFVMRVAGFFPLTNAEHSEMVIDKKVEGGYGFTIERLPGSSTWMVTIWEVEDDNMLPVSQSRDSERKRAIVMASLAAVSQ